jgi:para-nitrobenzyl esterase
MNRRRLTIGIMLSCLSALMGMGTANADMQKQSRGLNAPAHLHSVKSKPVRKKCSGSVIVTQDGPLRGVTSPEMNEYLGIPYADSPVGPLRWTPPVPHGRWHGVLEANQPGNVCPQLDYQGNKLGNEDCLFLNVYTPGVKKNQEKQHRLPVMVWIHGGAMVTGSGNWYDPTWLVTKGEVIVVTINYRLGALGTFAHPAIDAEGHLNANYGLMDQQFALQWVKRNIAVFGGDPSRVTIFGESAGGLSVYSQLASPTASGLFHRAIAQSGAYASFASYEQLFFDIPTAEYLASKYAESIGCSSQTADCLRSIPDELLVRSQFGIFYPVIDGVVIVQPPDKAFSSGQFNRVPVMTGMNHDESRYNIALDYDYQGKPLTDADYPAAVAKSVGKPVDDPLVQFLIQVVYPLSNYPPPPGVQSAPLALGAMGTDAIQACLGRNAAMMLSQYVPTYMYEFNDQNAPLGWLPPASFPLGAYHSAEIQYLFKPIGIPSQLDPEQQLLSDKMIAYWTEFAADGDPNSRKSPVWLPFGYNNERVQSLVPPMPAAKFDFDADHKCSSFWSQFF